MHGSYPRGFAIFFLLGGLFPSPGDAERDDSPPPGLLIDHKYVVLCTRHKWRYWFPYNSKPDVLTRTLFQSLLNKRHYLRNIIKTWTLYLKKKTEEKTLTTLAYGWRVKKIMFFATCFILNLAHTRKRPVNKLMAAFKGVFLSLFHKNTGHRSLFIIKLCSIFT